MENAMRLELPEHIHCSQPLGLLFGGGLAHAQQEQRLAGLPVVPRQAQIQFGLGSEHDGRLHSVLLPEVVDGRGLGVELVEVVVVDLLGILLGPALGLGEGGDGPWLWGRAAVHQLIKLPGLGQLPLGAVHLLGERLGVLALLASVRPWAGAHVHVLGLHVPVLVVVPVGLVVQGVGVGHRRVLVGARRGRNLRHVGRLRAEVGPRVPPPPSHVRMDERHVRGCCGAQWQLGTGHCLPSAGLMLQGPDLCGDLRALHLLHRLWVEDLKAVPAVGRSRWVRLDACLGRLDRLSVAHRVRGCWGRISRG
mmetsp:Transcript_56193/g.100038  ORF Transcript_56193/g.100038 Transcript_56193/m.100038 type:complete len:307 (-) Transcript_56193:66-986(-)